MPDSSTGSAPSGPTSSPGWQLALEDLVSSRFELFQLEFKQFREQSSRKAVILTVGAIAATSAWLLLLAGLTPVLAEATGLPWSAIALLLAASNFMVAIICLSVALRKSAPPFSATMAEFKKDREWLKELPNQKS